jgi:nucleoside-diphosphate-sugar epimerase
MIHYVVIGGRGWLGRAALVKLERQLGEDMGQWVSVFGSSTGEVILPSGRVLPTRPLAELEGLDVQPAVILHFAFLTKDKVADRPLEAFVAGNREISDCVAHHLDRLRPLGLVMPSSGAATQLAGGFEANPYGFMKRDDEDRFTALCADLGVRFSCPRLYNLSGPFINKLDSYVLACLIRDVQAGRPMVLRAAKPVIRSYVHVEDLLDVCLADMATDSAPAVFETAGELEIEVGDLARRVAQVLGVPDHPIQRPPLDPALTPDRYVGDGTAWRERLARHGLTGRSLDQQIADTAAYLAAL